MLHRTLNMPQSHRQASVQKMAHRSSVFSVTAGILISCLSACDDVYMASPLSPPVILDKAVEIRELSGKNGGDHVIPAGPTESVENFLNDASNHHRDIYFEHAYIHRKLEGTETENNIFQQTEDSTLAFAWITITAHNGSKAAQGSLYDLWKKMSKYDYEREWAFIEK